jgi:hypothetical protein
MLRERLREGVPAVLPQAVHGLGGVGKAQLALEYVFQNLADYNLVPDVWWIPDGRFMLGSALVEFEHWLGLAVHEALCIGEPYADRPPVFDNAENPRVLREYFLRDGKDRIGGCFNCADRHIDLWGNHLAEELPTVSAEQVEHADSRSSITLFRPVEIQAKIPVCLDFKKRVVECKADESAGRVGRPVAQAGRAPSILGEFDSKSKPSAVKIAGGFLSRKHIYGAAQRAGSYAPPEALAALDRDPDSLSRSEARKCRPIAARITPERMPEHLRRLWLKPGEKVEGAAAGVSGVLGRFLAVLTAHWIRGSSGLRCTPFVQHVQEIPHVFTPSLVALHARSQQGGEGDCVPATLAGCTK